MKIGIFGGSFNPPHKMHKKIALKLIQKSYVDQIIYVPTGNKYQKKELIDVKYRLEMLELMTKNNKNLFVSDYEVKNILTYTYQTLDYFKSIYPNDEIYFICGSDNLKEITTWKNYKYILNTYKILVIKRDNDNVKDIINALKTNNIILSEISPQKISSTKIRNDFKKLTDIVDIDSQIVEYIEQNQLYK